MYCTSLRRRRAISLRCGGAVVGGWRDGHVTRDKWHVVVCRTHHHHRRRRTPRDHPRTHTRPPTHRHWPQPQVLSYVTRDTLYVITAAERRYKVATYTHTHTHTRSLSLHVSPLSTADGFTSHPSANYFPYRVSGLKRYYISCSTLARIRALTRT